MCVCSIWLVYISGRPFCLLSFLPPSPFTQLVYMYTSLHVLLYTIYWIIIEGCTYTLLLMVCVCVCLWVHAWVCVIVSITFKVFFMITLATVCSNVYTVNFRYAHVYTCSCILHMRSISVLVCIVFCCFFVCFNMNRLMMHAAGSDWFYPNYYTMDYTSHYYWKVAHSYIKRKWGVCILNSDSSY